jgi:hypothetical protein
MITQLYFAYGSNIFSTQMRYRMYGCYDYCGTFILPDYKLTFDVGHKKFGTFANIQPSKGDEVEGVLYKLSHTQLMELDKYEGLYTREYFHHPHLSDTIVAVYVGREEFKSNELPAVEYFERIIRGCEERGLHKTLEKLENFKKENYKPTKNEIFSMVKGNTFYYRESENQYASYVGKNGKIIKTLNELIKEGFKTHQLCYR